jgi:hypothetical protein
MASAGFGDRRCRVDSLPRSPTRICGASHARRHRLRITVANETGDGQTRTTVVSSADEACAVIRHWLTTSRVDLAVDQESAE